MRKPLLNPAMAKCIFLLFFIQMAFTTTYAQTGIISGKVVDDKGPVPGATVRIKNTNRLSLTTTDGTFRFGDVQSSTVVLQITYIGYESKEVVATVNIPLTISITQVPNKMDEVVVTGTFDKRKRMDASVAITTLNAAQISRIVPASAADLLKNVPGVFVNSSVGEIRNSVSSRGITVGTSDGSFGYEYVSMQEDGLPITNTTYFNYGPDFFLRPDATLNRIDAVRGGTASIAAANAPGGIFNYISKTGGDTFAGEIRTKYGLVGNGNNSLGRVDADFGGPLGKNWFYNIGGFYRYDQGARYPGYPMNVGGQVKANLVKKYSRGSFKIFLKYLNDKNAFAQPIITQGYNDPKPAPGFNNNSTLFPPKFNYTSADLINGGTLHFDPEDQVKNKYKSIGFNLDHDLGNGWRFTDVSKYADNRVLYNTTNYIIPSSITDIIPYYILGGFAYGLPGSFTFKNVKTGQPVANVSVTGGVSTVTSSNLPGQAILPNSVLLAPLSYYNNKVNEFLNQFSFNKKTKNMNFTFGGYYGYTNAHRYSGGDVAIMTMENHPQLLSLSFTGTPLYGIQNGVPITGPSGTYQLTNGQGIGQLMGNQGAFIEFNAKQNQGALFFGHTWQINNNLTFDWGARYERVNVKGYNVRPYLKTNTGGTDNDPFTLYNNNSLDSIGTYRFNYTINTLSFSGALNYKFNDDLAIYGRYSQGKKAPDLDFYFTLNTPQDLLLDRPKVRTTQQIELGLKARANKANFFVTPFYSILSGVPIGSIFQNADNSYYFPPRTYAKFRTLGVEIEADINLDEHFSVRTVATIQKSKLVNYDVWVANAPGPADDSMISYSGKETDNVPKIMGNITPTYTWKNFYTSLTWSYMGSRQANAANVFKLPGFSQVDYSAGYEFSKHFQLSININNLFNTYGVMNWQRPGGLSDVLGGNASFSQAQYKAAVANNTPYSTVGIQPRAYYLTASFKF